MPELTVATPINKLPGAMVTPPDLIRASIKQAVDRALADIPPGRSGALVAVATLDGVNLAVAHKADDWEIVAWVGKSWQSDAFSAGAQVKKTW